MPEKKAAQPRENVFTRFGNNARKFIRETIGELRKVSWPTRKEALNLTWIVIIVITAMVVFLGFLDVIFAGLFKLLFSL